MTDIVALLRAMARAEHDDLSAADEAADEIEKLREEILQAGAMIFEQAKTIQKTRNDALEEAALVADSKAGKAGNFAPQIGRAATEIAAAIRALKEERQ